MHNTTIEGVTKADILTRRHKKMNNSKINWNNELISCEVNVNNLLVVCDSCGLEFSITDVQTDKNLICRCKSCGQKIRISVFVD